MHASPLATPPAEALKQAAIQYQRGDFAAADGLCALVLSVRPNDFGALNLSGIIAARAGRLLDGEALLRRAAAQCPGEPRVHNNLGNTQRLLGQLDEALRSFERALQLKADFAEAFGNRGNALRDLGRHEEALASYARAVEIAPGYAEGHFNRGVLLQDARRLPEALESYERALQIRQNYSDAHNNRGTVLRDLGRFAEALPCFERAVQLNADDAGAWSNRGLLLQDLNQLPEAIASFDRALDLNPQFAKAHLNRGYALLLAGEFAAGWAEHEWRWRLAQLDLPRYRLDRPEATWTGQQELHGKVILLYAEQGLGDTLQFCRYVPLVADRGATVVMRVPAALRAVLGSLAGVAELCDQEEALPHFDWHCSLMSLPAALGTSWKILPHRVPYLHCPPEKLQQWRLKVPATRRLRVGLVWSGGARQDQPELEPVNLRRNFPLVKFGVLRHPEIEFVSLQKGEPAESELAALIAAGWGGPEIAHFGDELTDFADTAGLLEQVDLLISVDTSTAHLAGALGKPVWLLNRFDTCWRWLQGRSDSPWYPTVRIFRQPAPGDWDAVMEAVRAALWETAGSGP
jgi:tetratricopeptide (TPR) repeat protein